MGVSGAPREQQIRLQDLRIRLIGNRIVLRSNRLGREVVPRLTAAHNFHRSHIPAYRFLCLIEQQEGGAAFWSWGALENAPFVPRVVFGRLVLSRARWRLVAADLVELRAAVTAVRKDTKDADRDGLEKQLWDAAQGLRGRLSLPRWVVMVEGDQELLVDFENPLSVEMFAYEAYKMDPVVFKEHFPVPGQLVARGPQGGYCHEMVLSFNQDRGRKP